MKVSKMQQIAKLCQSNDDCDFWSYEYEGSFHECFLKEALEDPECQGYRIWPFEDPHWQGASGPKICPDSATDSSSNDEILDTLSHVQNELNAIFLSSDCVKTGYDYGREYGDCGFANIVKMVVNNPAHEFPTWYEGEAEVDENLGNAADCQTMCQNHESCAFWSYEFENSFHECFLKEAVDPECQGYRIWPFEDPHWQGASGPKICPESATDSSSNDEILDILSHVQNELNAIFMSSDCVKTGYDYGRAYGDCGFATIIKMIVNNPDHEFPTWYDGEAEVDESLGNAADCQTMCQNHADCEFWSYEFEYSYHECFLKEALEDQECQGYRIWPFEDAHWQGASGPKICPTLSSSAALGTSQSTSTNCDCDRTDIENVMMILGIVSFVLFLFATCIAIYFYNKMMEAYSIAIKQQMSSDIDGAFGAPRASWSQIDVGTGGKRIPHDDNSMKD